MTRFTTLRPITLALLISVSSPVQAQNLASQVADGQPWTSTTPEGRKMTITFFPDGKARMKIGLMGRNLTWQPTDDGICLIGTPRGDACMRLEATANGYVGYRGDQRMMTLTR